MNILMSTESSKAILEGRKTQTRRTRGLSIINDPPQRDAGWQLVAVFQDGGARFATPNGNGDITLKCPYGGYGDRLWVREGFYSEAGDVWYKADGQTAPMLIKWRPSIFMPRWASRIILEITEIRVEKLNCMTESDAHAEGVDNLVTFMLLWDKLNKKRGYEWKKNCWVWVLEFHKV